MKTPDPAQSAPSAANGLKLSTIERLERHLQEKSDMILHIGENAQKAETRAETAESALREAKKCLRDATDYLSEEWQRWIHEIDCVQKEGDEETPDTCSCDGYEISAAVRALLTVAAQTPEPDNACYHAGYCPARKK